MTSTKTARRSASKPRTFDAATETVCGIYLRISEDPNNDEDGVRRQRKYCLALAKRHGWNVPEWAIYIDNDISATKGKPRPQYMRMLADIEAGRLHAIVSWHSDRIYRTLTDLQHLIDVVEQHDVIIRTEKAGELDLTTASGRMVARILGSVATHEGELKAERVMAAIAQKREDGKMPGGKRMFGWDRDGKLVEEEAAVVRDLARRIIAGEKTTNLCHDLNARGITTTQGNPWQLTALNRLLTNPRIAGHSTLKGEIVGRGQWEPLLDEDDWQTVVALLKARARGGSRPRVALLPGLIFCALCDTRLVTGSRDAKRSGGARVRTYRCPVQPGYGGCGHVSGDAEAIEDVVVLYAQKRLADPKVRRHLTKQAQQGHDRRRVVGDIGSLRERIAELDEELANPSGTHVRALLTSRSKLVERIESLEHELAEVAQTPVALPESAEQWPADLGTQRRLVELVVARVQLRTAGAGGKWRPERVAIEPVPMP